ncbi:CdaR family protein [Bacillus sp. 31A1R]|uniref:CdaR family protein n=1 Tax=Robertmurraya mangrovi TaxID=3098077 RepID=A0ABU5J405_9BACI|nr:CdaR family protein [Bacillus sp. 31A1R]MDZ5474163.1 CdaR family protein [Bacillus sp. 31A1R]
MDKYIDKMIDNRWFMKVVAIVLALLLFDYVNDGKDDTAVNVPQEQESETITDVQVKSYYDTESLVVTGVPETVTLTFTGPKTHIQQVKTQRNFEVYVNLSDAKIGTQRVPIEIKDVSDRLEVIIDPPFANVSVQEKMTKSFNIEAEYNSTLLATGYIAEVPQVDPKKVVVTGARDVIEKISYVKATVDIKDPINDTVTKEAKILVLDRELNKLNVVVQPQIVNVTIPVKASSKTVPIKVIEKGTAPNGVTIETIDLETNQATIVADEAILKETESVRVELDVSKIEEDTVFTLPVIISEGIVEVNPKTIKVSVTVNKEEDVTLSNLPIRTEGLSDKYEITFKDPKNAAVNLLISGSSKIVRQVKPTDFILNIDLSDIGEGEHDVKINVNGPDNINWKLAKETAKITITEKEEL